MTSSQSRPAIPSHKHRCVVPDGPPAGSSLGQLRSPSNAERDTIFVLATNWRVMRGWHWTGGVESLSTDNHAKRRGRPIALKPCGLAADARCNLSAGARNAGSSRRGRGEPWSAIRAIHQLLAANHLKHSTPNHHSTHHIALCVHGRCVCGS
jgi:hypothetical protein